MVVIIMRRYKRWNGDVCYSLRSFFYKDCYKLEVIIGIVKDEFFKDYMMVGSGEVRK